MSKKKMICIMCPIGCELTVSKQGEKITVEGNRCLRGREYGINEMVNPRRVLTMSVKVENGEMDLVSVRTDAPIPKKLIYDIIEYIKKLKVKAPVKRGEIIVKNIFNTGVNLIATRTVEKTKMGGEDEIRTCTGSGNDKLSGNCV
ncbi:DUF1667 domain-containing protein [Thermosipho ferrireducens]|uniref:DUF1667 domain-containing protein n=1 Tax=Thermosipho ferrireducens TaxID=2571116 RepID=UPI001D183DDA|nr:DUF1667 domain-containing protein [Thermosipho ferrireducens]